MGKCSYISYERLCSEPTWKGSDEYCIFHDPSPEKDIKLFEQKLEEKLEKKDYDFQGYYFPEVLDFNNWEFNKNVNFSGATFQKNAHFIGVTFQEDVNFREVTFRKDGYFSETKFEKDAHFWGATFQKDANFRLATFKITYFIETTFHKDAYFSGATFQDANFRGATFQKANFRGATFQEDANYIGATFQEDANYIGATFQDVYFKKATFQGNADFYGATFQGNADFSETKFRNVFIKKATFEKNTEFTPKQVGELNLRYAQFLFRGNITVNMKETKFHRAYLENVAFIDCEWPKKIYEEEHMTDEDINLTFKELETIYRDLKQNMQRHGDYLKAGEFYYREMECRKKDMRKKKLSFDAIKSLGYSLLKYTCGYGEKPGRTVVLSIISVFGFALIYGITGCLRYTVPNPCLSQQIKDSIYFSFVTFTTLGLGDIRPLNDLGKLLICCEAVIGAFLIALFVVVFARKMMR